jgi:hypothetical protein
VSDGLQAVGSEVSYQSIDLLAYQVVQHDFRPGCAEHPGDALTDALTRACDHRNPINHTHFRYLLVRLNIL